MCIFCKIISGEIPSAKLYEDDRVYAFRDINPLAASHLLVIPKEHISSAAEIDSNNAALVGHIFKVAAQLAKNEGLGESGYRIVTNVGEHGGQTVGHLHFHILGGEKLGGFGA